VSLRSPKTVLKAIECFEVAISLEPTWAPPFAMLAESYRILDLFQHTSSKDIITRATTFTERALRLDPESPQAHATMGAVLAMHQWKWKEGEQRIQFALRANPQSSQIEHLYSVITLFQRRYDEALHHIDRALSIDPSSLFLRSHRAQVLFFARRYEESIRESEDLLEGNSDFALGLMTYGAALLDSGRPAEALPVLERSFASAPLPITLSAIANARHDIGKQNDARADLDRLFQMHRDGCCSPTTLALGHMAVDEVESAFQWLETAASERDSYLPLLSQLPLLDPIRQDARLVRIYRQMYPE